MLHCLFSYFGFARIWQSDIGTIQEVLLTYQQLGMGTLLACMPHVCSHLTQGEKEVDSMNRECLCACLNNLYFKQNIITLPEHI